MLKIFLIAFLLFILIGLGVSIHQETVHSDHTTYMIGENVVFGKDTLMIVKYNSWSRTYMLFNGAEIDETLADKLHLKEQP